MTTYLILLGIGLAAGAFGAMVGLGGGAIMFPAIQIFLAYDLLIAVGTTLFAVIFTSVSAAIGHFKAGNVRLKSAFWIGLGGICGVLLGSYVFKQYLSSGLETLRLLLGIFFALIALRLGQEIYKETRRQNGSGDEVAETVVREPAAALMALGFFSGSLTGMIGLGGGFILTPGIMFMCAAAPHVAVGTTMLAMLPMALCGGLIKLFQGYVNLPAGIILGIGTAIGAQLGVTLSSRISAMVMKGIFVVVFSIMALDYLLPVLFPGL